MELISIIVPVYNSNAYLEKCLNSLINQTITNIEIIVINDGSKDNSLEIAKNFAKRDSRIKVYNKENGGLADARNYGINMAKGQYIGFVDADDYVNEDMFEILKNMIKENNSQIAICGWYLVENENIRTCNFKSEELALNSEQAIDMLLNHVSFDNFACNKLFCRSLFENIEFPKGKLLEDVSVMYKLIGKAKKIAITSKPLYYYVLHQNSITSNLYNQVNTEAFNVFIIRKNELLKTYPKLSKKIKSNYFTISKMYFIISLKSKTRDKKFERERIKDMRKHIKFVWLDKSIPARVKLSSTLISLFPYLYFKVRR